MSKTCRPTVATRATMAPMMSATMSAYSTAVAPRPRSPGAGGWLGVPEVSARGHRERGSAGTVSSCGSGTIASPVTPERFLPQLKPSPLRGNGATGGAPPPGRDPTFPWCGGWSEAQAAEQLVEQLRDQRQRRAAVEQTGDGAEQVTEQVAGAGDRGDLEVDRGQVDDQAEQVEMKRPEVEREDLARRGRRKVLDRCGERGAGGRGAGDRDGAGDGLDGGGGHRTGGGCRVRAHRAGQQADGPGEYRG